MSTVPPSSGVAALLHHSGQGSQFAPPEDDRQKRVMIREKERERKRLGLSAPDNYGGIKDKSFTLARAPEMPSPLPVIQKIEAYPQAPQQQYMPPPVQQPVYQPPPQAPPYQLTGQPPPPMYAPPPQLGYYPPPQQYGVPPQQNYHYQYPQAQPYQPPVDYSQNFQQQQQLNQQPFVQGPPAQVRGGGQPRQGQNSSVPPPGQTENFFDRFGQGDNQRAMNNTEDKARRLREELDQQVREKQARKEAEKLEKEKWEQKYGEGSWAVNASNPNMQQPSGLYQPGTQQPVPGVQQPLPGQQLPGQQFPGQALPGQQLPGQQFPGQPQPGQQPGLINPMPTQQPGYAMPGATPNPNQQHPHIQVHQLPGGGVSVAHGVLPDSSSSPPRTQNQVDAYKNELVNQIEEKKKKQDAEKKKKLEEDEKDELRVKKEMEELNKKYQAEIHQQAATNEPNTDLQDPDNPVREDQPEAQEGNGSQEQQQPSDQRQGRSRRGGPSQRRQQAGYSRRGQPPTNYGPQRNSQGYQDDGYYQEDSRQRYDDGGPRNNQQDDRGGRGFDQYQDYGGEQYYNEGGQNNQGGAPPISNNNSRNQQQFRHQRSMKQRNGNNYNQQYRDEGPPPNDQYYQEQDPYYDEGGGANGYPDRRHSNERESQPQRPPRQYRGPNNRQQEFNDGIQEGQMMMNRGPMSPNMMMMPGAMMPMPPPMMPSLDPLKMQLQSQFGNFQKDIMRLQHQQKQMMRNYHREIEMLQKKKQQIVSEMKTDQDAQIKLQIQSLSYAIQTLGQKMGRQDLGLPQSLSPQKNEIVAEVMNELRSVLPLPQVQQISYKPNQYSQSISPPPGYQIYQDDLYSDLPPLLQDKAMSFVNNQKNTLPQFINQKPQNGDFQLPSTTQMMPHDSPRLQQYQQPLMQEQYYQEVPEYSQPDPQYKVTKAKDPRARRVQQAPPPQAGIQEETSLNSNPRDGTFIFNPNAPVPGNHDGVYPNIAFPQIEGHTKQLQEKAQQIHQNPKSIDPRSQLKTSQQPRGMGRVNSKNDQSLPQIAEEADPLGPNIGLPHEIPSHASKLKQKAQQLKQQVPGEPLPPEEAIKNIQRNLLHPYQDRLDHIIEEDDDVTATEQPSPMLPQRQGAKEGVASAHPNLSKRPSISSLIRDSSREASAVQENTERIEDNRESAGEENPPPQVKHPASLRVKKQSQKDERGEFHQAVPQSVSNDERKPQEAKKMSVVDQIRYKNKTQMDQNHPHQNQPENQIYPQEQYQVQQLPQQQKSQAYSPYRHVQAPQTQAQFHSYQQAQAQHHQSLPKGASTLDQRQRISLINQDSDQELQAFNQQMKQKRPFEMIPQKPYLPAPTPYASIQPSSNTYFISSDSPSQQFHGGFQPPQIRSQDPGKPADKEQLLTKSLHLMSSQLASKSLNDSVDQIRRTEQLKAVLDYKASYVSQKAIFESLDSIRRKEDQFERASDKVTNQALIEALDSIRRLQSEVAIQESQQQMEELRNAQEQLLRAQQIQESRYRDMVAGPQPIMAPAQQRGYKIDQRAVNDALNSIRQVQANLESKNLLKDIAPPPGTMMVRGSQPPYIQLQEGRQQMPTIQSRISPQQLSPKYETQVFSPVGQDYINLTEDEYNQEVDQYSQHFESEQNPAIMQSQQYYQQKQQQMSPKMYQEPSTNAYVARGMESQGTLLDDPYLLSSHQNTMSMYGSPKVQPTLQSPKMMMQQQVFPQNSYPQYQAPPQVPDQTVNLQVDPRLFQQNLQNQLERSQHPILPPPSKIQPVVPDYAYDEEFVHYAKEDSVKNAGEQTPYTNELGSDVQSQIGGLGGLHKNHTPQNLIINVAPPEEEMHLGFNESSQEDANEGSMASPQKQRGLGRGAPRQEEEPPEQQPQNPPKVQSFHYNIAPRVSPSQQQPKQAAQQQLIKQEEVREQSSSQVDQSKKVVYPPPWRVNTADEADRTPLPVDVPPIPDPYPLASRSGGSRMLHKSHSQPPQDLLQHLSQAPLDPQAQAPIAAINITQGPAAKKPPMYVAPKADTTGYSYEPEGPQHHLEAAQSVLAQDVLYQQLQNYERQHMLDMQDYIKKQEELRKLEEEVNGKKVEDDQLKPLVFPDFTSFLYNKFLINGAPAPVDDTNQEGADQTQGINLSKIQNPNAATTPRAQFAQHLKNAPQFHLQSDDALPELERLPTRLILGQIKQNKQLRSSVDQESPQQPVRIIPHTPSLMMRPVTHAAPRPIENRVEEQEQFKVKVEEIQHMVDRYERIKKEVELERMEQEKRHNNDLGEEYMKSLKLTEQMVRNKDDERWRKKMESGINVGSQQAPEEGSAQIGRHGTSRQGHRPKFGSKVAKTPIEETPQERQNQLHPIPESKISPYPSQNEHNQESEYRDDFQQSYNNQSDDLNIADADAFQSSHGKSMPRSDHHQLQHQQVLLARAEADMKGVPRVALPQISASFNRPMSGQTYLRDMMSQIPSINNPNAQSKTKPPLPPIITKAPSVTHSRNPLDNSGYIPKHFSQQAVQLPQIQRYGSFRSNEERESEKSVIDIFNPTLGHIPYKPKGKSGGGSLNDLFDEPTTERRQRNGNDPFSIRDRLRQTLQDTAQMMRIDNVNLLQKVKEFDRTIKPSSYEQGLPPIIDIANNTKQSAILINNAPNQIYVEEPVMVGKYDGFDPANFPNNFQDWEAKRQVAKHKEDRYNIRGSGIGDQSFQDNGLVKEMMQTRNQPLVKTGGSSAKLQPLPQRTLQQSSSVKILPQSLMNPKKHMLPGQLGQNMEQTIKSQPSSPSLYSNKKLNDKIKDLQSRHGENESHASSNYNNPDDTWKNQYRVIEHIVETQRDEAQGRSGSSQVLLPTISQSQGPALSSGDGPAVSNAYRQGGLLAPGNQNGRDSFISDSDQTMRNVQVQKNIDESPEGQSARQWVSHWFKDAKKDSQSNSPQKINEDLELSVDQQSAKKYLQGIFNLGGSLKIPSQPKIMQPVNQRPTTPAITLSPSPQNQEQQND